jgi:hypothetical protein
LVYPGESTLLWPKDVVTNVVFQNYATFNFHQANILKKIVNYTQNKVVQLSNNAILKEN